MTPYKQLGWWIADGPAPQRGEAALIKAIRHVKRPVYVTQVNGETAAAHTGNVLMGHDPAKDAAHGPLRYPLIALLLPVHPEALGDSIFKKRHGLRYAYIAGAMANGITSVAMVEKMGRAGMLGFFGAAGLSIPEIESAVRQLKSRLPQQPFGFNLIHSPNAPTLELETVRLYLDQGVRLVSASAYMDLTLPLVYYRVKGIHRNEAGKIIAPNKVIAKVSREEVARKFFSPAPVKFLKQLLERNMITEAEAQLAESIPMADDLTAEADSGGHTDNRPALSLLPAIMNLRDRLANHFRYSDPPCVGLGGGIATPESAAAAFAMGAGYILTGTVNQACIESGTCDAVRQMLAEAGQADVTMAPAADMFEMGIKVQVLKRGTMFPLRAARLYELYSRYDCFDDIPENQKTLLQKDFFRKSFQEEWNHTRSFFLSRDPSQIARAEKDPKYQMALVFRSYLGQSSTWANTGEPSRRIDYQIWCGPSIGAFNAWVKGSFLENPEKRETVTVALNLLWGASTLIRRNLLQLQGIHLSSASSACPPLPCEALTAYLQDVDL
jgi:PfaD family protein